MFNGFDKDLLMLGGTVAGFLAAVLSILEKVLHLQERFGTSKDKIQSCPMTILSAQGRGRR